MDTTNKQLKYFLYTRKSTDEKERQILSLPSQRAEALKRFGDLKIISLPGESVSAFEPYKRPVFADMIARIKKGEAQGIIAWHPDRLSRNPMDAAQIIYLVDTGKIKDLKFNSYYFDNSPEGKMMLQITLSQSKYSSDKLSKDVKRGLDKKASTGWRPGLAPLGYLNSKIKDKGEQTIHNDPERYQLVKQIWQMMLTGNYTIAQIHKIATDEWKLRLPATKKRPTRKMRLSGLYKLFTTTFYYGYYEWPSETWHKGNHEPMISEDEYDRVQFLLGRKGRPRPKTHKFAFTGLMRCGGCGASITAEEKFKKQKNGNTHHYIYYHCTRKINPHCVEKHIELKELSKQVDELIGKLTISERFKDWAIKYLHEINKDEARTNELTISTQHKRHEYIINQLDNLVLKYTSAENSESQIITEEEYARLRSRLLKEKNEIEKDLNNVGEKIEEWVELTERTFNFARYARAWFNKGDLDTKRAIFACLGSHLLLQDKKLTLQLKKPFNYIFEGLPKAENELSRLEPVKMTLNKAETEVFTLNFPILSGRRESNSRLNLGKVT